jgi:hypothetical protein
MIDPDWGSDAASSCEMSSPLWLIGPILRKYDMKFSLTMLVIFSADTALADPGHLIEVAGHNHWLAGLAVGGAITAGLWGALKGQRKESDDETEIDEAEEPHPQEA